MWPQTAHAIWGPHLITIRHHFGGPWDSTELVRVCLFGDCLYWKLLLELPGLDGILSFYPQDQRKIGISITKTY